ncbi:MAG: peptidylprolyl isomerase [Planctomycetaceae bacterium]|jgi:cyclophilin family peptidyl-prolyl cis-trans isomerase|nr:peptidylprolyl isomerase [Planctomycetaceae bacterium]
MKNSISLFPKLELETGKFAAEKKFPQQKTLANLLLCGVFCCLTIFVTTIQMTFAQPETNTKENAGPAANNTTASKTEFDIATAKAEVANLGAKNKDFMTQYGNYAEVIKKLQKLKVEYASAKPERVVEIDKEYSVLLAEGKKINEAMLNTGIEAYVEAPKRNIFVNNFLFSKLIWEFNRDNFEVAVKIFKSVVDKGIPEDAGVLYTYAGLSAVMTCDLGEAAAWLKIAKENKSFEQYIKFLQSESSSKAGSQMSHGEIMAMNFLGLSERIADIKADWDKEKEIRQTETKANEDPKTKLPRVELNTSKGKIVIELFENEAPNSVANFIALVEKKYYNGTKFHRVLPCFMAQGGDNGRGGPGYQIADECRKPDARKHFRGSLSMANAGPNTNGSQFFLTFVKTEHLDGKHTVFGRVVEGIDVLADIQRIDPEDTDAVVGTIDEIIEAKVLNKRDHAYEPVKL